MNRAAILIALTIAVPSTTSADLADVLRAMPPLDQAEQRLMQEHEKGGKFEAYQYRLRQRRESALALRRKRNEGRSYNRPLVTFAHLYRYAGR